MYKIETKNKEYTGRIACIDILNGVGKIENISDDTIKWLKSYGHKVTKVKE